MDLQERMADLMKHTGWSVGDIARIAKVSSSAVSQWYGHGEGKRSKSIGNIEAAMRLEEKSGFNALWLAKGKGAKFASSGGENHKDSEQLSNNQIQEEVIASAGDGADTEKEKTTTTIPTSMRYEPRHLKSAILLMGSLLGALDARSRSIIGDLLKDLSTHTDDAQDIAEKASVLATVQKPVSKNKALNKAIHGRGDPVETGPAPLEH